MQLPRKKTASGTKGELAYYWKSCTSISRIFSSVSLAVFFMVLSTLVSCKKEKVEAPVELNKTYGGPKDDWVSAIAKSRDGGFVLSGFSNSFSGNVGNKGGNDIWIQKINKTGNIVWEQIIGGSADEDGRSIIATPDGGYLMAGVTHSTDGDVTGNHGMEDIWLVKLDASGRMLWQKTLGGSNDDGIGVSSIIATNDGGYILAGATSSNDGDVSNNHGDKDGWLVKLNSNGNIIWQKTIGGSGSENIFSMIATPDGGFLMTGQTSSNSINGDDIGNKGSNDVWVVKVNASGDIMWQKAMGGEGDDNGFLLTISPGGGYVMSGYTASYHGDVSGYHGGYDAWIVKFDNSGNMIWQKALGGSELDYAYTLITTPDGGSLVGAFTGSNDGDVSGNHGGFDAWLVKINREGVITGQKLLGGTGHDNIVVLQSLWGGGYIAAGNTTSMDGDVIGNHGGVDRWVFTLPASW
jgi:hypothetical protein